MSRRYEFGRADIRETPTEIVHPYEFEEVFGEGPDRPDDYALTIGDPYATAYALAGTREELQAFTAHLVALVARL
jgi:hypothetical protein